MAGAGRGLRGKGRPRGQVSRRLCPHLSRKSLDKRGTAWHTRIMQVGPALLSVDVAAARLGVCPRTLARWRVRGEGPAWAKLGGRILYSAAELLKWVRGRGR